MFGLTKNVGCGIAGHSRFSCAVHFDELPDSVFVAEQIDLRRFTEDTYSVTGGIMLFGEKRSFAGVKAMYHRVGSPPS